MWGDLLWVVVGGAGGAHPMRRGAPGVARRAEGLCALWCLRINAEAANYGS